MSAAPSFPAWLKDKLVPKIYLLTTSTYPTYEYPVGSGVRHEYPHYKIAGRKLPTGHVGVIGILGVVAVVRSIVWLTSSSPKAKSLTSESVPDLKFPAPVRDYEKEKQEFIANFIAVEEAKAKLSPVKHH